MIYTMTNIQRRGIRVRIFDANGQEQRFVTECDTETGRLRRWKAAPDGGKRKLVDGDPVQETVFVPAPLSAVERPYCGLMV